MIKLVRQQQIPVSRVAIVKLPIFWESKPTDLELIDFEDHYFRCSKCLHWCNVPNTYILHDPSINQYKTTMYCRECISASNHNKPIDRNPEVFDYFGLEHEDRDLSKMSPEDKQDLLTEELAINYFLTYNRNLAEDIKNDELLYTRRDTYSLFAGDKQPLQPGADPFRF